MKLTTRETKSDFELAAECLQASCKARAWNAPRAHPRSVFSTGYAARAKVSSEICKLAETRREPRLHRLLGLHVRQNLRSQCRQDFRTPTAGLPSRIASISPSSASAQCVLKKHHTWLRARHRVLCASLHFHLRTRNATQTRRQFTGCGPSLPQKSSGHLSPKLKARQ